MKKSEFLPKENTQESTQEIESNQYVFRSLEEVAEIGFDRTYEWFEDMVIRKKATVDFKTDDSGFESAIIRLQSPQDGYKEPYYTSEPKEISRLKTLKEGKVVVVED